jgi:hypothetical protein
MLFADGRSSNGVAHRPSVRRSDNLENCYAENHIEIFNVELELLQCNLPPQGSHEVAKTHKIGVVSTE